MRERARGSSWFPLTKPSTTSHVLLVFLEHTKRRSAVRVPTLPFGSASKLISGKQTRGYSKDLGIETWSMLDSLDLKETWKSLGNRSIPWKEAKLPAILRCQTKPACRMRTECMPRFRRGARPYRPARVLLQLPPPPPPPPLPLPDKRLSNTPVTSEETSMGKR